MWNNDDHEGTGNMSISLSSQGQVEAVLELKTHENNIQKTKQDVHANIIAFARF